MIRDLFEGWGKITFPQLILLFLSYAIVIMVALPIHEMAHAYTADKMGDQTARWNGRLTLNPFAHLDIWGTLMIFAFGFGFAKPVPINPRNFRDYRTGMILTAFAGPFSNFLMGFASLLILRILYMVLPYGLPLMLIGYFFSQFAQINISLAVFNLIPIPPLDGYRIVSTFLPARWQYVVSQYEFYITIGLFLLIGTGSFSGLLRVLINGVYTFLILILHF